MHCVIILVFLYNLAMTFKSKNVVVIIVEKILSVTKFPVTIILKSC